MQSEKYKRKITDITSPRISISPSLWRSDFFRLSFHFFHQQHVFVGCSNRLGFFPPTFSAQAFKLMFLMCFSFESLTAFFTCLYLQIHISREAGLNEKHWNGGLLCKLEKRKFDGGLWRVSRYANTETSRELIIQPTIEEKQDGVTVNTFEIVFLEGTCLFALRKKPFPCFFRSILLTILIAMHQVLSDTNFCDSVFRVNEVFFQNIILKASTLM